jgi:hypothetical protein
MNSQPNTGSPPSPGHWASTNWQSIGKFPRSSSPGQLFPVYNHPPFTLYFFFLLPPSFWLFWSQCRLSRTCLIHLSIARKSDSPISLFNSSNICLLKGVNINPYCVLGLKVRWVGVSNYVQNEQYFTIKCGNKEISHNPRQITLRNKKGKKKSLKIACF